jgi:hypothetical protein
MDIEGVFTVWCDGQLVGRSSLDYIANTSEVKFGDFTATRYGEQLIAIRMLPRQAQCAHAPLEKIKEYQARRDAIELELRAPGGRAIPTDDIEITDLDWLMTLAPSISTDEWEMDAGMANLELVEELDRRPGEDLDDLIPAELLECDEGIDARDSDGCEIVAYEPDGNASEFPRYQIQVRIKNGG